jgi:uncharacterized protein (UPF0548 family)
MLAGADRRSFMVLQGFDCWQAKPRAIESWCYYKNGSVVRVSAADEGGVAQQVLTNIRLGGRSGVAGCEAK